MLSDEAAMKNLKKPQHARRLASFADVEMEKIRQAKKEGRPIVAVGTTALRALESASHTIFSKHTGSIAASTQLFIRRPYQFKVVDALVTNFHVPDSSLIYLVDAFFRYKKIPRSIESLYREALKKHFRFYSFGDAMLIV